VKVVGSSCILEASCSLCPTGRWDALGRVGEWHIIGSVLSRRPGMLEMQLLLHFTDGKLRTRQTGPWGNRPFEHKRGVCVCVCVCVCVLGGHGWYGREGMLCVQLVKVDLSQAARVGQCSTS
jgi:hypothetical protein